MRYSDAELCLTLGMKCPTRGIQVLWTWDPLRHHPPQTRNRCGLFEFILAEIQSERTEVCSCACFHCKFLLPSGIYVCTRSVCDPLRRPVPGPSCSYSCMVLETQKLSRDLNLPQTAAPTLILESESDQIFEEQSPHSPVTIGMLYFVDISPNRGHP
jgi:hypothetical protein